jgi:hypothetical protein
MMASLLGLWSFAIKFLRIVLLRRGLRRGWRGGGRRRASESRRGCEEVVDEFYLLLKAIIPKRTFVPLSVPLPTGLWKTPGVSGCCVDADFHTTDINLFAVLSGRATPISDSIAVLTTPKTLAQVTSASVHCSLHPGLAPKSSNQSSGPVSSEASYLLLLHHSSTPPLVPRTLHSAQLLPDPRL